MSMFENPLAFILILVVPLFYVLKKLRFFSKPIFPLPFEDWEGRGFDWKSPVGSGLRILSRVSFIIGYIFLVISLSGPTLVNQERVYTSRSSDVIFVLDVSPSMAAMDIASGTRLDAAKQAIQLLINENNGTAYGLVSCASEAALLVPPTMDHESLITRLDALQIGELEDKTALGIGISTAIYHLISTYSTKKSIVLLTDGENNAGAVHPQTASALAKDNGIVLYIAGIGTRGTVPIEYVDPDSGQKYSGFLDSNFDNTSLRTFASMADGKYFSVETLPSLSQALESIKSEQSVVQSYYIKRTNEPLYLKTLLLSLVIFCFTWIIRRIVLKEVL